MWNSASSPAGVGDASEVQGLHHQAGAGGVQLHASELVWGVPVLPSVPRQGAAHHCLSVWGHHWEGSGHIHGSGSGSAIRPWSLTETVRIQNVLLWNCSFGPVQKQVLKGGSVISFPGKKCVASVDLVWPVFDFRLKDYPQYCQHLASIAHFLQFPHHLQEVTGFLQSFRFGAECFSYLFRLI